VVAGDYTLLTSCAMTLTPSTTIHVTARLRDASQHFIVAGTQCASTADHAITAAGFAGLAVYGPVDSNSVGIHFDNFVVTDVTAPIIDTTRRFRLRFSR